MPQILVLNNYPLNDVWGEVQRKDKPDHHLYGINHFYRRGYEFEIIYRPGKTNVNADALSGNPVNRENEDDPELPRKEIYE